ncbi:MAG TPA: hypothetical protein VK619_11000 [Pyrinomonadaceae bacterium]|nr:hypothetical protein [Pyrinomonadaceae bacterium]
MKVAAMPDEEIGTLEEVETSARQPRGLTTLFFTELWERFSYYGMRAILVLYMVAPVEQGGLRFDVPRATSIYGTYTMFVYLTALPGGLVADHFMGARLAVLIGGFFDPHNSGVLVRLYGGIAVALLIGSGLLALLTPTVRKLMSGVK